MLPPRSRLLDLWDRMRTSYWFVPSVMFIGALALAFATVRFDLYLDRSDAMAASDWFPRFSADASRSILSTLASGMLTVTGIVFSLTIVALQLASSQFGPRLLRTFMTSRGTQIALGTFTSSFLYCLLVIGTVRGDLDFVPQISTATGIVLAVVDIGVLIYFVHHLATSIRIESLLATVVDDLRNVIDELFPSEIGQEHSDRPIGSRERRILATDSRCVRAAAAGYIRRIDSEMLMRTACDNDLILRIAQRPGAFVVEDSVLLRAWPENAFDDKVEERLRRSVVLGSDRTPRQDVGFAIRQLVEVGLRALSPGINDPFTAIECTDRLAEALCTVARRPRPSPHRFADDGRLRVIAEPMSLDSLTRIAFDPLARAGGANGDVAIRLLEAVATVASCACHAADRNFLIDYARGLEDQMQGQMPLERDREAVRVRSQTLLQELRARSADADRTPPLPMQGETV